MTNKLVTLAAIGVIGFTLTPAAHAQSVSRTVSYGDLNLSHTDGIERLDRRIAKAAKAVCDNGDKTLRAQLAASKCRDDAISGAVEARSMAIAGSGQVLVLNTARVPRSGR
jgi:UrcA family protein